MSISNFFSVCPSIRAFVTLPFFFQIPAVISQNVTDESCLAFVKSEKYVVSGSPSHPLGPLGEVKPSSLHYNIRQGEAKLHILTLTSVFHCLSSVGPKQLCASTHLGCTHEVLSLIDVKFPNEQ